MIKEFNRQTCRETVAEVEEAIKDLLKSKGVSVCRGNASFSSDEVQVKFILTVNRDGDYLTKEQLDLDKHGISYGIKLPRGAVFIHCGKPYVLYGLKPTNRKPAAGISAGGGSEIT